MLISESVIINASDQTIWNHLKSLQDAEKYVPVVTHAKVDGVGLGATRICDVQMGEQNFQICETLVKLDESQKSLTISIDNAPTPPKDLKIDFSVNNTGDSSQVIVSNESEQNSDGTQMIRGILAMICMGLKEFHEQ